jgi:hypothetical protein
MRLFIIILFILISACDGRKCIEYSCIFTPVLYGKVMIMQYIPICVKYEGD